MTVLFETLGPAIGRASWQGAALALLVGLLLWGAGDRLAPRWRFLLWGVVLLRLVCVVTPGSPWSPFNLVGTTAATGSHLELQTNRAPSILLPPGSPVSTERPLRPTELPAGDVDIPTTLRADAPVVSQSATSTPYVGRSGISMWSPMSWTTPLSLTRVLSLVWLAGCVVLSGKLLAAAVLLRRRLSACRPVTDARLLGLLEACGRRLGVRRLPPLLVTPVEISPYIVGTWNPRIVLPESLITEASNARLRHVLAHELAHLVRGDLWTNWLLLAARTVHWFNPAAWWVVREMQSEREAACDELAFTALEETDRSAYAATIVELAASLTPSVLAPGLIGLFSSNARLKARVVRLVRSPSVTPVGGPIAAGLLLGIALLGLTDAMPAARAQQPKPAASSADASSTPAEPDAPAKSNTLTEAGTHTEAGRCVDQVDRTSLAGITMRLYRASGRGSPIEEVASTVTDAQGRYKFTGLAPRRREDHFDYLDYVVMGFSDDRPIGRSFRHILRNEELVEVWMAREKSTIGGKVVDAEGRPIAGAQVIPYSLDGRPIPGLPIRTTFDKGELAGRFHFDDIPVYKAQDGSPWSQSLLVLHPDHPPTTVTVKGLPAELVVTLPTACLATGTVIDEVTGKPAAGALVTMRRLDAWGLETASTDNAGRYRLPVAEGRYNIYTQAKDRVSIALTERECQAGQTIEVPLTLIEGGFISGRVLNTATGAPVTKTDRGDAIALGLMGPSQPDGRAIHPARLALVDEAGRFTLRAAPGENFPYLVNTRGDRMAWDTQKQPAIVVKAGETTSYDMLVTPPVPEEEKLKEAQKIVDALPKTPAERAARIFVEFRKLRHTVDECELWCLLMRELVAIGPKAVPWICDELDQPQEDRAIRRLAFALRAIGDPRAVPALIRAIPRTLLPPSSDYGLLVADNELTEFMQKHDLDKGSRGHHFNFGRPVREVFGTLHALTKQDFDDLEVSGIHRSEDPRRQALQRRLFQRQATRWQTWWEANWRTFTEDEAYRSCRVEMEDTVLPPPLDPAALGKTARVVGEGSGYVASPAIETGNYAWHFYDLDTGYHRRWPAEFPAAEAALDSRQLADWAAENGIDLMCVTHRAADGTETFVLRGLGMTVQEITSRDARNLERSVAAGALPKGRPVEELLMHYDESAKRLVPNADGAFLFTTREGSVGLIQTTDRVTKTADLTGSFGAPAGVGFHKGVRFDLKAIMP
ncbi:M56 family metallopeptidase [Planctomyces sp. SH-PL14]|uniref:M56 family metallopeptidase n=1 Tax=Planctomyces sp. SH-PL14 TaxID=1632864 RepID=UPI00078D513F|nr:M56 family metallopeptidase [Planctomyces sp. SH-PL14]AMV18287.1 Regulatory protein BlaR1 [Planctomyces sp. SH-PL14]